MMIMILFLRRLAELSSQLTREDDDDDDGDGDDDDSLYDKKLYSSFDRAA